MRKENIRIIVQRPPKMCLRCYCEKLKNETTAGECDIDKKVK